jgi:hypothetical protein
MLEPQPPEPQGPVEACSGKALPLPLLLPITTVLSLRRAFAIFPAVNYSAIAGYLLINNTCCFMRWQYQGTQFRPIREILNNNDTVSLMLCNDSFSLM